MNKAYAVHHQDPPHPEASWQCVELPSLNHLISELEEAGIELARVDLFQSGQVSELSFVYYVSLIVYVTAVDRENRILYEYKHVCDTQTSLKPELDDEVSLQRAEHEMEQVTENLKQAGLSVHYGRYVIGNLE